MKKSTGYFISFSHTILLERLTLEEKGKLLDALNNYAQFGTVTNFDERYLNYVYDAMRKNIDSYYKARELTFPNQTVEPAEEPEPEISVKQPKPKTPIIYERPVKPQLWLDIKDAPEPIDGELALDESFFKKAQ